MQDSLGRHHHDFPLDQLEPFVLAEDAGFDHAADVLDGKTRRGKPSAAVVAAMFMAQGS
jgi:hypothetical protein